MHDSLNLWQTASALFFLYTAGLALIGRSAPRRGFAFVLSSIGLVLTIASIVMDERPWLHDWVLPPTLLLLGYWSSGALFSSPMGRAEDVLMTIDRRLGIADATPPAIVAEVLEAAYVGVYPTVAVAYLLHRAFTSSPDAGRFWAVILITDFICFGMLPWIQTRPPRALEPRDPRPSSIRTFNLRLLGATSIHANTFPSGHTAEAMAAALLVLGAPLPVVVAMFGMAFAISLGAVLGRYHYALDAAAGWLVAVGVWLVVT